MFTCIRWMEPFFGGGHAILLGNKALLGGAGVLGGGGYMGIYGFVYLNALRFDSGDLS